MTAPHEVRKASFTLPIRWETGRSLRFYFRRTDEAHQDTWRQKSPQEARFCAPETFISMVRRSITY